MCITEKPGKPDTPDVTSMTNTTAALAYKPPADDGGSEIFNYVIEYRVDGGFKWVRANADTVADLKYTVKGLMEDTMYEFRFAAENRAGVGPFSDPTEPFLAKTPVGKLSKYKFLLYIHGTTILYILVLVADYILTNIA